MPPAESVVLIVAKDLVIGQIATVALGADF